ncbi:TlpA family protein disulfide reductase [Spirochaeta cellobiosiphila]|uniref:TlpA family protein disulfide reductase n=1 Tax=Spirochaeta cellobiosiphila TaxID=504483 RepID=UPI00041959E3|nr:TlpA disulfide reductase family protein [Spirochaeta cellobiosiphila]
MKINKVLVFILLALPLGGIWAEENSINNQLSSLGFDLPTENFKVPQFQLEDLQGTMKPISTYEGKVVLLNFWATWCPPCREEMPSMQKLYNEWSGKGFEIVAINLSEKKDTVQSFLTDNAYTYPVLMDYDGAIGSQWFGVTGIPTTFVLDKNGMVRGRLVGTRDWNQKDVKDLLAQLIAE